MYRAVEEASEQDEMAASHFVSQNHSSDVTSAFQYTLDSVQFESSYSLAEKPALQELVLILQKLLVGQTTEISFSSRLAQKPVMQAGLSLVQIAGSQRPEQKGT